MSNVSLRPQGELQPAGEIEEGYRPTLELLPDDAFGRQPKPIATKR
ncbi:MAG: hypothetical protein ABNH29_04330 [Paracoccus sp. (in: a-proteobacteria)]|jgi:hypothetical protein